MLPYFFAKFLRNKYGEFREPSDSGHAACRVVKTAHSFDAPLNIVVSLPISWSEALIPVKNSVSAVTKLDIGYLRFATRSLY